MTRSMMPSTTLSWPGQLAFVEDRDVLRPDVGEDRVADRERRRARRQRSVSDAGATVTRALVAVALGPR